MRRRSILVWLAAAVFILAAPGAPRLAAAGSGIERRPEFVDRVSAAIDRGVVWLRSAQQPGGPWQDYGSYTGAMTALAYYTLRVCGVPRDDPAATSAFSALRQSYESAKKRGELQTYSVALFAMALAEHGDPVPSPNRDVDPQSRLSDADAAWMKELVGLLEGWQDASGRWSYSGRETRRAGYDHSNTQYALLGLKAASRAGVKVKSATWMKSLKHLLAAQENDGPAVLRFEPTEKGRTSAKTTDRARGWGYTSEAAGYGSMTAGGVGSVVICRSELLGTRDYGPGLDAKADQSARDGIAWLGSNFSVTTNPPWPAKKGRVVGMAGPVWHYYYLYALERAGVLAGVEWMGERDWYGEGADFLVRAQLAAGAWTTSSDVFGPAAPFVRPRATSDPFTVQATCFALLFLKKGTLPVARGAVRRSFDETDLDVGAAGALSDADFENFVDLVLSRWRRATDEASKERIFARTVRVGSRIVPPLLVRLSSMEDSEREAAIALLLRATGLEHGFDPAASSERREDAIARWQAWWFANEKSLHFDAASGRLTALP